MNENYLHFIWRSKRLPFHLFKTTKNQDVIISHPGFHNTNESGPDFNNGKIIIDGLEWYGNIELHVKSSDWYTHKHHIDLAYNNVILHVVYENDCDVEIQHALIPTIELKSFIDWDHFHNFNNFISSLRVINCAKSIKTVNQIYIESMMERALIDRLNRKSSISILNSDIDPKEYFYFLTAKTFGFKVNELPFEELVTRLPLSLLKKHKRQKQFELIFATSGLLQNETNPASTKSVSRINAVAKHSWKRKGLRPQSFPEIRVHQFALFVSRFDFEMICFVEHANELLVYIRELLDSISKENELKYKFSKQVVDLFTINCIVPFLWWLGNRRMDEGMKESALEILKSTNSEKNAIIKIWQSLDVSPNSAYESQALIELYNVFCLNNKCLSCEIGVNVLKQ